MDAALDSMRAQAENVTAQRNGSVLLAHFLKTQEGVAAELLLNGGLQVILTAMRKHRGSSEVQRWCCEVLAELARHGRKIGVHAIVSQGGVDDVVLAMQEHQHNVEVQKWGAAALGCMASSGAQSLIEAIEKNKVIATLVSAMRIHPCSTSIQEYGTSALSYIAMDGGGDVIISEGGLDTVVTAMRTHLDNPAIQRWGLATMWGIVEDGGSLFFKTFTGLDGLPVVFQALSTFLDCSEVQHWGLVFLRGFSMRCDEDLMVGRIASETLLAVIAALTHFPNNIEVQQRGLTTLAILAGRHVQAEADHWTSGLEMAALGMRCHPENVDVQRCGMQAIAALLDARRKSETLDRTILTAIVATMGAHLHDLEMQVNGQDVLWTMTHNASDDDIKLVLEVGSVQAVMAATRAHPNSDELAHACKEWSLTMERMSAEAEDNTTTATESGEDGGGSDSEDAHLSTTQPPQTSKALVASDSIEIEF